MIFYVENDGMRHLHLYLVELLCHSSEIEKVEMLPRYQEHQQPPKYNLPKMKQNPISQLIEALSALINILHYIYTSQTNNYYVDFNPITISVSFVVREVAQCFTGWMGGREGGRE